MQAAYAYTAANADELTFDVGDMMYVSDMSDPNWWVGFLGDIEGLIPASYVEVMDASPPPPPAAKKRASPWGGGGAAVGGGAAAASAYGGGGGGYGGGGGGGGGGGAALGSASKEGWMKKQGRKRGKWVQRWFKLEGTILTNGKDQFSPGKKQWLLDRSASVRVMRHHDPTMPPVIEVRNPNSSDRKMAYFQVTTEQEAQEWEAAINAAIS